MRAKRTLTCIFLALVAGCSQADETKPARTIQDKHFVTWSARCENASSGRVVTASAHPIAMLPGQEVCAEQPSEPVEVRGIRFIPQRAGDSQIVLKCDSEQARKAATARRDKIVYLSAGDKVFANYIVAGHDGEFCRLNAGEDMVRALEACESIAELLGFEQTGCLKVCASETEDVCIPVE